MISRVWILAALLAVGYTVQVGLAAPELAGPRPPLADFPLSLERWVGRPAPALDAKVLAILGASDHLNRYYVAPGRPALALYTGYYRSQRQGEAMHSPMNCLPGAGWQPLTVERVPMGTGAMVNRVLIQKGVDQQIVVYWYQSPARVVASEYWSKFYLIADAFRSGRTDAAFVRVVSPVLKEQDGEARASAAALELARLVLPRIQAHLFD
jgi:EpsI family protein